MSARTAARAPARARPWVADVLGVAVVVVAALVVLAPVLRPGVSLGPFDLLSRIGLTRRTGVRVHSAFPADQILYFLPMTNVAWHQVHSGHLPLWNPDTVLGTPLAFNWQSGVFSVPDLVAYLVPLRYVYTVIVLVKLLVSGTGAYFLCRVLRLRPLPSALGGVVFELSGPMLHYSGWAMTSVTEWSGWLLGLGILLVRGRHRRRDTALLAVVGGLAVYGGHPESLLVLAVSAVVFFAVFVVRRRAVAGEPLWRPVTRLGVAGACGVALGAPLVLPGLQVVGLSSRAAATGAPAFGLTHLSNLVVSLQGTDFRVPPPYVGVIALALAALGLRMAWRQPAVLALGAMAAVATLLTFHTPLYAVLQGIPTVKSVTWNREAMLLALAVAVLAAVGLEQLLSSPRRRTVRRFTVAALAAGGAALAVTGLAMAAGALAVRPGQAVHFAWPAAEAAGGLLALVVLGRADRSHAPHRGRAGAAGSLLVLQAGSLVLSGIGFWSLSDGYFTPTPAVTALHARVGDALVARGPCQPLPFTQHSGAETGIRPDANIAFGIREFAAYEPVLPHAYYRAWTEVSGDHFPRYLQRVGVFCPQVTTAVQARVFGVSYILAHPGDAPPAGTVAAGSIGGDALYRVPGSADATLVTPPAAGPAPVDAAGSPVTVRHPDDATWRVVTDTTAPALLRLRLTAEPGWHATVDGRPVTLRRWAKGSLLEGRVGAGHHVVVLHYWPGSFTAGLVLAAVTAGGLALWPVAGRLLRPRPARRPPAGRGTTA